MTRPLPAPEELINLVQESLRNADDLLEDARLLLDAGRAPRAHALATLALEEVGKSHLCIIGSGLMPIPGGAIFGPNGEDFWTAWQRHPIKLFWVRSFLEMVIRQADDTVEQTARRLADQARAEHLRKLRGLYVDYDDDTVKKPSAISISEARELIEDASLVLTISQTAWSGDEARERALDLLSRPQELGELGERIAQAIAADPEAAFAAGRTVFADSFGHMIPVARPDELGS